jgi:hypothetical protein
MTKTKQLQEQVFSTYKSWDTFLELKSESEKLKEEWCQIFQQELKYRFEVNFPEWQIHDKGDLDFCINLKEEGSERNSLEFWFENNLELNLYDSSSDSTHIFQAFEKAKTLRDLLCKKLKVTDLNINNNRYLFKQSLEPLLIDNYSVTQKEQLFFFAGNGSLVKYFDNLFNPLLRETEIIRLFRNLLSR